MQWAPGRAAPAAVRLCVLPRAGLPSASSPAEGMGSRRLARLSEASQVAPAEVLALCPRSVSRQSRPG